MFLLAMTILLAAPTYADGEMDCLPCNCMIVNLPFEVYGVIENGRCEEVVCCIID